MKMLPVTQGDRVRNAFNGETFIFTHVSENAEVVQFDVHLEPGGMLTGTGMQHVHPGSDEKFTVISGKLAVVVDGAPRMLEPGQSLNVLQGRRIISGTGMRGKHSLRSVSARASSSCVSSSICRSAPPIILNGTTIEGSRRFFFARSLFTLMQDTATLPAFLFGFRKRCLRP